MASLRERYKVSWDDGDEVEVRTTVQDLITASDMLPEGKRQNLIAVQTALIYCALRRQEYQVPSYGDWLLILDNYTKLPTQVIIEGPTSPAALPEELSQSLASQGPTGGPGSAEMMTEPSVPQNSFS